MTRYILFVISVFCLSITCVHKTQNNAAFIPPANIIKIKILENNADEKLFENKIDSAICLYQEALNLNINDDPYTAKLNIKLGACFFNINAIQKSISYLKRGLRIYKCSPPNLLLDSDFKYSYSCILLLANCYRLQNQYDSALYYLDEIMTAAENNVLIQGFPYPNEVLVDVYTWKALILFDRGQFEKSIIYNIKAIEIIEKEFDNKFIAYNNYAQLGRIFMHNGDYIKAEKYHKKASNIIKDFYGDSSLLYAEQITDLGLVYYESKKYQLALEYFDFANKIIEYQLPKNDILIAFSLNNLADAFCGLNQFTKAISYYNRSLELFSQHNYIDEVSIVYHNLGIAHYRICKYGLSKKYYNLSLGISKSVRSSNNIFTCYTYQRLGQLYFAQNKFDTAIAYYANAVKELSIIENESTYYEVSYLQNNTISKTELYKSLYYKGICEINEFYKEKKRFYLLQSIRSFQKALQLQDILRKQYSCETTILSLNKFGFALTENYLFALLQLNDSMPCQLNNNLILEAIERNKYTALRSLMHTTKSKNYTELPAHYKASIDDLYKKKRYDENIVSNNPIGSNQDFNCQINENQLFETTFSLDTFMCSLKQKYPNFYKSQFRFSYFKIDEIQSLLPDSVGIIEYYYADSIILIFAINKTDYELVYSLCDADFVNKKNVLRKSILFSNTLDFIHTSNYFYCKLIDPIYNIIENLKSLIIIPDSYLSNIPFEVLLSSKEGPGKLNSDYLIQDFDISYYFSLNLWGDNNKSSLNDKRVWENDFSGFAPLAKPKLNQATTPLPYTEIEINNIANIFLNNGKRVNLFCNSFSTENTIYRELMRSRIVHIASHCIYEGDSENYSIIVSKNQFQHSGNSIPRASYDDGMLNIFEIYNSEIKSDLVTLSVCSSGLGKANTGEGITSLATGFFYSGAKNILYTLWDVSDVHTRAFMTTFYYYISNGYSYPRALRKTKLDFLNSNYYLPVFWSGYILNG